MPQHPVVSRQEWLTARKALLLREKEATHLRDQINAERLALPWVKVDKNYTFETPNGKKTLADLFDGRTQLIVYHFMLGPGWAKPRPLSEMQISNVLSQTMICTSAVVAPECLRMLLSASLMARKRLCRTSDVSRQSGRMSGMRNTQ